MAWGTNGVEAAGSNGLGCLKHTRETDSYENNVMAGNNDDEIYVQDKLFYIIRID